MERIALARSEGTAAEVNNECAATHPAAARRALEFERPSEFAVVDTAGAVLAPFSCKPGVLKKLPAGSKKTSPITHSADKSRSGHAAQTQKASGSPGSKIRVFVIEDHPTTARALKMFLETSGFSVEVACDAKSALELAPKIEFDVLLCDLNLPDGTGWDLLTDLRKTRPDVRALAFSAFDDLHHVTRSRAAGFLEHVVKGAPPEELVVTIRNAATAPLAPLSKTTPPSASKLGSRTAGRESPGKEDKSAGRRPVHRRAG
jgi:DNA-binding NarL/FixJ family response regulator